jgi:glycosyltransferase involved in cell wall biosynthesis
MGDSNALEYLVAAAAKCPTIAFILIGDGINKVLLQAKARFDGSDNIYFFNPIAKNTIPDFLDKMDALYIGWNNIPLYRFGISPNKIFDYMMAKKPILHSITIGNDLVKAANCGITVPAANVEAIARGVMQISSLSRDELIRLGQNGYEYVIKNHDYKVLATKFLDVCTS